MLNETIKNEDWELSECFIQTLPVMLMWAFVSQELTELEFTHYLKRKESKMGIYK